MDYFLLLNFYLAVQSTLCFAVSFSLKACNSITAEWTNYRNMISATKAEVEHRTFLWHLQIQRYSQRHQIFIQTHPNVTKKYHRCTNFLRPHYLPWNKSKFFLKFHSYLPKIVTSIDTAFPLPKFGTHRPVVGLRSVRPIQFVWSKASSRRKRKLMSCQKLLCDFVKTVHEDMLWLRLYYIINWSPLVPCLENNISKH